MYVQFQRFQRLAHYHTQNAPAMPLPSLASLDLHASIIILLYLPTQHTHPEEQHRSHNLERKRGLPALTDVVLREPRKRLHRHPRIDLIAYIRLTIPIHVARAVELDGRLDQGCEPQHEQDETAQEDDAGDEEAL